MSDDLGTTTVSVDKKTTHKYLRRIKKDRGDIYDEPSLDDVILSLIPDKWKDGEQ